MSRYQLAATSCIEPVNPAASAPIVGATKRHHLPEAAAALELKLTGDEAATLEKPYSNHGPSWY